MARRITRPLRRDDFKEIMRLEDEVWGDAWHHGAPGDRVAARRVDVDALHASSLAL